MLSPVADCIYWITRHLDRAESGATLVDTTLKLLLTVTAQSRDRSNLNWRRGGAVYTWDEA